MSIPDRFYRIARSRLADLKEWLDRIDADRSARDELNSATGVPEEPRAAAERELRDAMQPGGMVGSPRSSGFGVQPSGRSGSSSIPSQPPGPLRSPSEISGQAPLSSPNAAGRAPQTEREMLPEPVAHAYHLLGLQPGADLGAVRAAHRTLAARCEPSRFPAGSPEEAEALAIRRRLDQTLRTLEEALDPTLRRFDLLEFDTVSPPAS